MKLLLVKWLWLVVGPLVKDLDTWIARSGFTFGNPLKGQDKRGEGEGGAHSVEMGVLHHIRGRKQHSISGRNEQVDKDDGKAGIVV